MGFGLVSLSPNVLLSLFSMNFFFFFFFTFAWDVEYLWHGTIYYGWIEFFFFLRQFIIGWID